MRWYQKLVGRGGHDLPPTDESVPECESGSFVRRDQFLSLDELNLHRSLARAIGSRAIICPKVRAADVLAVLNASTNLDDAIAIDRKSVGFLLCDTESMRPSVAVSLLPDGESLKSRLVGKVERALCAAGIPVVFVSPEECSVEDLRNQILPMLAESSRHAAADRADRLPAGQRFTVAPVGSRQESTPHSVAAV